MGDIYYRPLIEDMVWSYSRIDCFDTCPYKFFLKYIKGYQENDMFYASYGSFMHELIERFYKGELTKDKMISEFLSGFSTRVRGMRPNEHIVKKYIDAGCRYLRSFEQFPYKMIDVEKKVRFSIEGYEFIGFIDFVGSDGNGICIIDNKSRELSERSNRNPPTKKDQELDLMLRQLYLYSVAIEQEYGTLPYTLCFNCFKSGIFIKEEFDKQKYEETKKWAVESIEAILNEEDFEPKENYFSCIFLCGVNDRCLYNIQTREEMRRR